MENYCADVHLTMTHSIGTCLYSATLRFPSLAVFVNQKFLLEPAQYLAAMLENEINRSIIVQKRLKVNAHTTLI